MAVSVSTDSLVQVAPDSGGKKVRNLSLTIPTNDGSENVVYMQVVSIADETGRILKFSDDAEFKMQMLEKLDTIIELMAAAIK